MFTCVEKKRFGGLLCAFCLVFDGVVPFVSVFLICLSPASSKINKLRLFAFQEVQRPTGES